jgi:predicted RNA-binding Zn-ribbon protein involved in translation (DUF1610 family)
MIKKYYNMICKYCGWHWIATASANIIYGCPACGHKRIVVGKSADVSGKKKDRFVSVGDW